MNVVELVALGMAYWDAPTAVRAAAIRSLNMLPLQFHRYRRKGGVGGSSTIYPAVQVLMRRGSGVVGIAGCLASEMGKIQNLSGYARSFYCGGIA